MLQLTQVSKAFAGRTILHQTDLSVQPGETTVLIGPSGCGKSTLLRMMVGLLTPDSGTVTLNGQVLTPTTAPALRQQMGYVIQDGGLFPHLSAANNIGLLATHLGWERAKVDARVEELCGLTRFPREALTRFPAQLSGGQRQRVGLMRALMLDPAIVLLDEPLGALDPLVRYDLQTDLKEIFQSLNKTVVLVTHDLGEAGFFGNVVVLLGEGRIVQQGTLQDLIQKPAEDFVSRYVRSQRGFAA